MGSTLFKQLSASYLPIILIVAAIMLLAFVQNDELEFLPNEQKELKEKGKQLFKAHDIISIALLIGVSIIVRSIGGSAIQYDWKTGFGLGLAYTIFVVLGKMFGGLIGDTIGLKKTAVIALLLACISLILGFNLPTFGYIGIFLFNIPMSITLLLLEKCNLKNIATMVGLNTLYLFVGYVICLNPITLNNYAVLITSIILAIICIFFAFRIFDKKED